MASTQRIKILLADDGSQHAQAAVDLILNLSLSPQSRIRVLRAFMPTEIDTVPMLRQALERTKNRLEGGGLNVSVDLLLGTASEVILGAAETDKPRLIVMGAKGLRATLGILLGGVAQHVVENAACPVLIVRAPYEGLQRVLLVTDGSTYSQAAARFLARFPLPQNADIRLMHVMPPLPRPIMMEPYFGGWQTIYPVMSEEEEKAMRERQVKEGQTLLARTSNLLRNGGLEATPVLVEGDAATEILEYAKANQIDLVVAGSRGLGQVRSLVMGSVSRKLVHYAGCSVLIVKRPGKE